MTTTILWKEAPFFRTLIPLAAGITLQWYFSAGVEYILTAGIIALAGILSFQLFSPVFQFRYSWLRGILINALVIVTGCLLVHFNRLDKHENWIGNFANYDGLALEILEPLSEKEKSFKTIASSISITRNNSFHPVKGKIILYFRKNSLSKNVKPGTILITARKLQPIRNSGNPGEFDFKIYCSFQQIYFQQFLEDKDYVIASQNQNVHSFLFGLRHRILAITRKYIPGKKEAGLAEALLIGYKGDLDKELTAAYSNTGVVHVIAISGLHVGLVYCLLSRFLRLLIPKRLKWLNVILVLTALWIFSLVAGGSPSVLRSTVMFTCIVLGENISRNVSIYNSLAASAFLLLCYNPFWLWDVGFQLSYAAVLSIVIFMKPVYDSIFIRNKLLDSIWKLAAVTISAQILTTPISLFYFHQFPNFFLITNLVAVPLSSIILTGEIVLCLLSPIQSAAIIIGKMVEYGISIMNRFVEYIASFPLSVTAASISLFDVFLLYVIIFLVASWVITRKAKKFILAQVFCVFVGLSRWHQNVSNDPVIIVYNIPGISAIDFMEQGKHNFRGDEHLIDKRVLNYHFNPSRNLFETSNGMPPSLLAEQNLIVFMGKSILVIDQQLPRYKSVSKIKVDIVVISHNAKVSIYHLMEVFSPSMIVFDSSNPVWKVKQWKFDCAELDLRYHSVRDDGAFVMKMN